MNPRIHSSVTPVAGDSSIPRWNASRLVCGKPLLDWKERSKTDVIPPGVLASSNSDHLDHLISTSEVDRAWIELHRRMRIHFICDVRSRFVRPATSYSNGFSGPNAFNRYLAVLNCLLCFLGSLQGNQVVMAGSGSKFKFETDMVRLHKSPAQLTGPDYHYQTGFVSGSIDIVDKRSGSEWSATGSCEIIPNAVPDTTRLNRAYLTGLNRTMLQWRKDPQKTDRWLAWMSGRLKFQNTPFPEVVRELERWYDVKIDVTIPSSKIDRLNASFQDEPLSEILSSIAAALDLRYERDKRHITFFPIQKVTGYTTGR